MPGGTQGGGVETSSGDSERRTIESFWNLPFTIFSPWVTRGTDTLEGETAGRRDCPMTTSPFCAAHGRPGPAARQALSSPMRVSY